MSMTKGRAWFAVACPTFDDIHVVWLRAAGAGRSRSRPRPSSARGHTRQVRVPRRVPGTPGPWISPGGSSGRPPPRSVAGVMLFGTASGTVVARSVRLDRSSPAYPVRSRSLRAHSDTRGHAPLSADAAPVVFARTTVADTAPPLDVMSGPEPLWIRTSLPGPASVMSTRPSRSTCVDAGRGRPPWIWRSRSPQCSRCARPRTARLGRRGWLAARRPAREVRRLRRRVHPYRRRRPVDRAAGSKR